MSNTRIQVRRGTTSQWESANPVLASGEIGFDQTTGIVKVGNGVSPWSLLPIGFVQGTDQSMFGDGSDGNVIINDGGTVTLTRTMYYNNLTVSNNTTLNNGGFRIFVRGILSIHSGSKIVRSGGDGGNGAAAATGGSAGAALAAAEIGGSGTVASAGANGGITNGGTSSGITPTIYGGGLPPTSGSGGAGSGGSGGSGGGFSNIGIRRIRFPTTELLCGASVLTGGASGRGGGGGGGNGSQPGAGGGGGGTGGGVVAIWASEIENAGSIEAIGGNGGNGGNASNSNCGGGGGGAGGGGGFVYLVYNYMTPPEIDPGTILVTGGAGGTGGSGNGSGSDGMSPGNSPDGVVFKFNMRTRQPE